MVGDHLNLKPPDIATGSNTMEVETGTHSLTEGPSAPKLV